MGVGHVTSKTGRAAPDAASSEVVVCEVWPRDGIQGWGRVLPTAAKLAVIEAVVDAGVREVDATSLVSPAATAQFGDAADLLERLASVGLPASFRVLAVNRRSVERLRACGEAVRVVDTIGSPISASEEHNLANLRKNHADQKRELEAIIEGARELDADPLVCVATAFGSPLSGVVSHAQVLDLAGWAYERGVRRLMLGDTTGMADPRHAADLFTEAAEAFPDAQLTAHFHDTRGSGIANTIAAVAAGVKSVDSSLGGLGGEPPTVEQNHSGETGNVCTEDLVALFERMGFVTGIDMNRLLRAGRLAEEVCGVTLRSQVQRAGLAVPAP